MATIRTIAALLLVLVAVTLATADDFPSRSQIRRWMRECRKESKLTKSKPIYAVKKTIAGIYDPRTRHAFRKTKMTFAKFEFAKIRKATEAEKCLVQCMAEKQDMINGTQLNSKAILKAMMGLGKHINEMDMHTKCNMTELKRSTEKCIVETHGSVKNCDLGYNLYECLKTGVMESLYDAEEQNATEASGSTEVTSTASPTTETYQRTSTAAPATSPRSERMHGHRFGHGPRYPRPIPDSGDSTQAEQDLSATPQPRRILRHPFRGIRRFPPPPADSADVAPTTGDSGEARDMLPPPPPTTGFGPPPPPPPMEFNEIPPPPMAPHVMRPYGFAPRPMAFFHHPMGHHHMGPHPMHYHPMGPHHMPFNGMGPTHMPFQAMPPPPLGMSPSYVSYRQGAGMVQVYGENPAPWRQNWREMQRGQQEMTAIA